MQSSVSRIAAVTFAILASSTSLLVAAKSLRAYQNDMHEPVSTECTLVLALFTPMRPNQGEDVDLVRPDSPRLECELDPIDADGISGIMVPLLFEEEGEEKAAMAKYESGEITSNESTLLFSKGIKLSSDGVHIPFNTEIVIGNKIKKSKRRNLATVSGTKPILVVKVTDNRGLALSESTNTISDDVFGTSGDRLNLKSHMSACSFGKLNIVPGDAGRATASPGVIEVTIPISLKGHSNHKPVRDAITAAVSQKLGFTLPGPYQQVMYLVEDCYGPDCKWAAYAFLNSWLSVYRAQNYKYSAVQMHEIGHNFNLGHSGGLDGKEYTDHTGLMGNPWFRDDQGAMCFNAARSWQIGWYDSHKLSINPREGSWTGSLVGVADYRNNPQGHPVVVKIETGTGKDLFVGFNRATGVNRETKQGKDQVTVIEARTNNSADKSRLRAIIRQGGKHVFQNWAGANKPLTIQVNSINTGNQGYANVSVCLGTCRNGGNGGGPGQPSDFLSYTSGAFPSMCLDLSRSNAENMNDIWLYRCNGTPAQKWKLDSNGFLRSQVNPSKCLVPTGRASNGSKIVIYDCSDRFTHMKWSRDSRGRFVLKSNGKCLDVAEQGATSFSKVLQIYNCNDRTDKIWNPESSSSDGSSGSIVDKFDFRPFLDSSGNDIKRASGNINAIASECFSNPRCAGFNSNGWMKHTLRDQSQWSRWTDDSTKGFYVKKAN